MGREVLTLAEQGGFDLLLLDVHMPEVDGFQVVRAVRERESNTGGHLPIIAFTARSRNEDRERCLAAGMDDFQTKQSVPPTCWQPSTGSSKLIHLALTNGGICPKHRWFWCSRPPKRGNRPCSITGRSLARAVVGKPF